jgi:hypothetical protein
LQNASADVINSQMITVETSGMTEGAYCLATPYIQSMAVGGRLGARSGEFVDDGFGVEFDWYIENAGDGVYIKNALTEEYICATADGFGLKSTPDSSCVIKFLVFDIE